MRVYVAGKYDEKQKASAVMALVRALGHEITYDWTTHPEGLAPSNLQHAADLDLGGVLSADAVVILFTNSHYAYRGTFTELGAALAKGLPVYAVCPDDDSYCRSNCFFYASGVTECASVEEALAELQELRH